MMRYRVILKEEPEDTFTSIFDCAADDGDHAEEQALDMYPEAEIMAVIELEDLGKYWKTTLVIYSEYDPRGMELDALAHDADVGDSYCFSRESEPVEAIPEDAEAFFSGES